MWRMFKDSYAPEGRLFQEVPMSMSSTRITPFECLTMCLLGLLDEGGKCHEAL